MNYFEYLKSLFCHKNAILGSEIINNMVEYFSITREYARKLLSLAVKNGVLFSSKPFRYSNGQFAYSTINNKKVFLQLNSRYGVKEFLQIINVTPIAEPELIKYAQAVNTISDHTKSTLKFINDIKYYENVLSKTYKECNYYYLESKEKAYAYDSIFDDILSKSKKDSDVCRLVFSYFSEMNLIYDGVYRHKDSPMQLVGDNYKFDMICYSKIGQCKNRKRIFVFEIRVGYPPIEESIRRFFKRTKALKSMLGKTNYKYPSDVIGVIVVRDLNRKLVNKLDPHKNYVWIGLRQLFGKGVDDFLSIIEQDAHTIRKNMDDSFYDKIQSLSESDFSHLFGMFLDDCFEIVVNSCMSSVLNINFHGEEVSHKNQRKEYDGYYMDNNSIWIIEAKNYSKSRIKWFSCNSDGKIDNDCLQYFFVDKVKFLKAKYPWKKIYAAYVSKSGYSKADESENKIQGVFPFPCFNKFLLKPQDIVEKALNNGDKEFLWLKKLYLKE